MSDLAMYHAPIPGVTYRLNNDFVQPCVMGFNPSRAGTDQTGDSKWATHYRHVASAVASAVDCAPIPPPKAR
jgi:hypothetical protein